MMMICSTAFSSFSNDLDPELISAITKKIQGEAKVNSFSNSVDEALVKEIILLYNSGALNKGSFSNDINAY